MFVVIAVVSVAVIAGCGPGPVATIDGVKITDQELNERLVKSFGHDVLRDMIDRELLRQAARDRGIEVTDEELQEELDRAMEQFPSEEMYHQWLASRDMSQDEWEDHVKMAVLTRKLATHDVDPSEDELRAFYEEHRERFREPAMVAYGEIVVSTEDDAREVIAELERGEASFADLARQYSMAPSRDVGGERREMPIDAIPITEVREIVRTLPIGEVSDPIPAEGQWYIVTVRDRQDERQIEWDADRDRILEAYQMAHAGDFREILREQIQKTRVNILDPRFQGLSEVYTPIPDELPQFGIGDEVMPLPEDAGELAPPSDE